METKNNAVVIKVDMLMVIRPFLAVFSHLLLFVYEEDFGAFELAKEIEAKSLDKITIERAVVEENSDNLVLGVFPISQEHFQMIEDGLSFTTARTNDLIHPVDIVEGSKKQVLLL